MRLEQRFGASIVAGSLLFFGFGAAVSAEPQSLGDVARRESERRREAATAPGRVYTNGDLAAIDPLREPAGDAAAAPVPAQEAAGAAVTANDGATADPQAADKTTGVPRERRDEGYWRARARDVRERLAKASADLEATRSSLSALDSAKTPAAARERIVVAASLRRLESDVRSRQLEEVKLRTQAELNHVPATWIQ
jgi:hypothetical protein